MFLYLIIDVDTCRANFENATNTYISYVRKRIATCLGRSNIFQNGAKMKIAGHLNQPEK